MISQIDIDAKIRSLDSDISQAEFVLQGAKDTWIMMAKCFENDPENTSIISLNIVAKAYAKALADLKAAKQHRDNWK